MIITDSYIDGYQIIDNQTYLSYNVINEEIVVYIRGSVSFTKKGSDISFSKTKSNITFTKKGSDITFT